MLDATGDVMRNGTRDVSPGGSLKRRTRSFHLMSVSGSRPCPTSQLLRSRWSTTTAQS